MNDFIYIGCFVKRKAVERQLAALNVRHLEVVKSRLHVTFAYKPQTVDRSLFGERVRITAIGYGNDGKNEGLKVTISSDNPEIMRMFNEINVPHITLSTSADSKAVDTYDLEFTDIEPFEFEGVFGGYIGGNRFIFTKQ